MQAASLFDGFLFVSPPFFGYGRFSAEVDVSRRQIVQALVISAIVIVLNELADAQLELAWQVVVLEQCAVFHRAVRALDLALLHRMVRPAADMADAVILEPVGKLAGDVGWTVIAEQSRAMANLHPVQTGRLQCNLQRVGHVSCRHGGAQLPGQDIAREVIEHSGQIEPAPTNDLQIGEVGLPNLVWSGRRIGEAVGRLHQDEGWASDQAMVLQEPIDSGLRHKAALGIREVDGELPWRQVRLLKGQIDDRRADLVGDLVPDPPRSRLFTPPTPAPAVPVAALSDEERRAGG